MNTFAWAIEPEVSKIHRCLNRAILPPVRLAYDRRY
jgi:hypothetical protein